ncbi:MAG: urea ABC transporter permease subunit UrtB [Gammaproteobacteria bacterium]
MGVVRLCSSSRGMLHSWRIVLFVLLYGSVLLARGQEIPVLEPPQAEDPFVYLIAELREGSLREKIELLDRLSRLDDARVPKFLRSWFKGRLFYLGDSSKAIVYKEKHDRKVQLTDVISGESLGDIKGRKLKKFQINNKLRSLLRTSLARMDLNSDDPAVRLEAVRELGEKLDRATGQLLQQRLEIEPDGEIREEIETTLALLNIRSSDSSVRLAAIETLAGTLNSAARLELAALLKKNSDGSFVEADESLRKAAQDALDSIALKTGFYELVQTLFFGLSLGSVLALAAIGLAITFGVMGVINMAHGELMMLGAYTTYVVQLWMPEHLDLSLFAAIPAAFVVSGIFGILIERGIIRFLYGRPLETLLATFGVSLVLQQMVRSIFSPLNRSVTTPAWMSGSVEINSVLSLTLNRVYIIAFALIVFFILLVIMKKTRLGLEVRAVAQNRSMAKAMGIRSDRVDALTFGLGSGIAGIAGVALSQLTNVGPNLGQSYIVDSFMVVVFGGVGNLWGTLVSGLSLGVANKILEPYAGAVLAKIIILVAIILFIQKWPRGLFPQKGRAAEN